MIQTLECLPLNLSRQERQSLFGEAVPRRLGIVVATVEIAECSTQLYDFAEGHTNYLFNRVNRLVDAQPTWIARLAPAPASEVLLASTTGVLNPVLRTLLHPDQHRWAINGLYPLIGYFNPAWQRRGALVKSSMA